MHVPLVIVAVLLASAGVAVALIFRREFVRPRVLCLMYHRFASRDVHQGLHGTERIFTLPIEEFEQQVACLKNAGFTFVGPDELRRHAAGEITLPDPSVLLTFDDGCISVAQLARPVLERHNACGVMFVTTDPSSYVFSLGTGRDRRMTDEELQAADGAVLRFESHAVTHRPLRAMADGEIRRELLDSKNELQRVLGRTVEYLAIPGNWFDRRVMRIAREVGYKAVWCSFPSTMRRGDDLFRLPRINVEGHLGIEKFRAAVSPTGIAQRRLVSLLKRIPGRLLGPRLWLPLRKVVMGCIPGGYISTRRILGAAAVACLVLGVVAVVFLW